jgi:hypothetical protein
MLSAQETAVSLNVCKNGDPAVWHAKRAGLSAKETIFGPVWRKEDAKS